MFLLTLKGAFERSVAHRFDQDVVRIGRSSSADLVLRDPDVSRIHVEVRRAGAGWQLVDEGSTHGTTVNGVRVEGTRPLANGDVIGIGGSQLIFEASAAPLAAATGVTRADDPSTPGALPPRRETSIVGQSDAMRRVLASIEKVAPRDATVLVRGEPGTGKELVARLIHERSRRSGGPFVVVNCPALPPGLVESELFGVERGVATGVEARMGRLESAHGGTLFLDEVGDLDSGTQARLLRFMQERTIERVGGRGDVAVDARVVAATNADLESAVKRGAFRADLLHRLDVVRIQLPPLRDRAGDLPVLVDHFLRRRGGRPRSASREALALLEARAWPGNVRELAHAIERACMSCASDVLEPADLDDAGVLAGSTAAGGSTSAETDAAAQRLRARIVDGGESFWDVVRGPFLRRELPKETVRRLVQDAWEDAGGSYKRMARTFGIEKDHKKLLNFLWAHGLGADKGGEGTGEREE